MADKFCSNYSIKHIYNKSIMIYLESKKEQNKNKSHYLIHFKYIFSFKCVCISINLMIFYILENGLSHIESIHQIFEIESEFHSII